VVFHRFRSSCRTPQYARARARGQSGFSAADPEAGELGHNARNQWHGNADSKSGSVCNVLATRMYSNINIALLPVIQ
jgi:hypothetical protein